MVQAIDVGYSQKQRFKRYNVNLMSVVSSDAKSYAGFIQNVSEEGLAYESYSFVPMLNKLSEKKIINLMLKMPSGETLNLNCEVKWSSEPPPWSLIQNYRIFNMGMKIIDPPLKYREYVNTLQHVLR